MKEILKKKKNKFQPIKNIENKTWVNLYKPNEEDIKDIFKKINLKKEDYIEFKEDINSLKDLEEIPIIEKWDNNNFFIILKTAQKGTYNHVDYYTIPLGIIITKENVITISFKKNEIVEDIKQKNISFEKINFVEKLLLISSRKFLSYLKEIDRKIKAIEHKNPKNKDIVELQNLKKSLVLFNTALKNNQILFERLLKYKIFNQTEENTEILEDIIDENKQGIEMANIYNNIIKDTLEVFSSIISNNLNKVVKTLTSITIIIAIPTLIASIYGMNLTLPFQNSNLSFGIVMFISLFFTILMVYILYKQKWI